MRPEVAGMNVSKLCHDGTSVCANTTWSTTSQLTQVIPQYMPHIPILKKKIKAAIYSI